jgi:cytoskeletal protein CcmA (bactofilin family)
MFFKKQEAAALPEAGSMPIAAGGHAPNVSGDNEDLTERKNMSPAIIGPSICIKGDVTGDEDVVVEGRIEGTVSLAKNCLTVGTHGNVNAKVNANTINIEGHVQGDLVATDQVVLLSTGKVLGNIKSPRVTLQDGCKFKGAIDMDIDSPVSRITDLKTSKSSSVDSRSGDKHAV